MLSKRINREPRNDNYRRLARYIADADHDGEKSLMSWCAGCWSGDDEYDLAIQEVVDTQALNTRTTKEKTYHLMISFNPVDEPKLTPDVLREIENEFAAALGFEDHQRHCGVHKNTTNLHMHVAYNMIHPERHTRREPFRDFWRRDELCRRLEQKYGLVVDNGRAPDQAPVRTNVRARALEIQTGQQSFDGYVREHQQNLSGSLEAATSWTGIHQALLNFGLEIRLSGAGLAIKNIHGKEAVKASTLGRTWSKANLEKRFGPYQPLNNEQHVEVPEQDRYRAKALHHNPDRDHLYADFVANIEKRRAALAAIKANEDEERQRIEARYKATQLRIKHMPLLPRDRARLNKTLQERTRNERAKARATANEERAVIRAEAPYTSWTSYLQWQAAQGSDIALAILRSQKEEARPAPSSIKIMRELLAPTEPKFTIDTKGSIIFTLPDGGAICDNGKEIHFSIGSEMAKTLADKLAQAKRGQQVNADRIFPQEMQPQRRAPGPGR